MAKIAAIVIPTSQADRLSELGRQVSQPLCLGAHHLVESESYFGERMVCLLMRIAPDPLNPRTQPIANPLAATVACGYYLTESGEGDCATRLSRDLTETGEEALPLADGIYAFAHWDRRRECLVVGVDKLGMRPLFWMALPAGGYAVASEIKALVALSDKLETNWTAWEEQLSFGFLFGNHTYFHGIERLGGAEVSRFDYKGRQCRVVENFLETIEIADRPFDEFLEEQGVAFDGAMARLAGLYNAPDDTMLTLSGGFDSRRILGWLLDSGIRPTTYTVPSVEPNGDEYESSIVRELCRYADLDSYLVYPETFADRALVRDIRDLVSDFESDEHQFFAILAAALPCYDKVNFDGLGAGSQLSGSFVTQQYFSAGGKERFLADLPRSVRSWLHLPATEAPPLAERVRADLECWGDNPNKFAYFYLMSRTRREIALAPHSIHANVFESLCPFLDRNMMRSALSFPPTQKIGGHVQGELIARLNPELAKLATAQSHGADIRYKVNNGDIESRVRLDVIRRAAKMRSQSRAWASSTVQRLRFRMIGLKVSSGHNPRLRWEFGKASRIGQLAHFEKISESAQSYQSAVQMLGNVIARRADWCRPL